MTQPTPPAPTPRAPRSAAAQGRARQRRIIWTASAVVHAVALVALYVWLAVPATPEIPTLVYASFSPSDTFEEPDTHLEEHEPLEVPEELLPIVEVDEPPLEVREDEFAELDADVAPTPLSMVTTLTAAALRRAPAKRPAVIDTPPTAQPVARAVRKPRAQPRPAPRSGGGTLTLVRRPSVQSFYPFEARQQGIEGETIVLIEVDLDGHVVRATVRTSSGYRILDAAALRVAYAHLFARGVTGRAELPVRFRLVG